MYVIVSVEGLVKLYSCNMVLFKSWDCNNGNVYTLPAHQLYVIVSNNQMIYFGFICVYF